MKHVFTVSETELSRLDLFISRKIGDISRTKIQSMIKAGYVLVDGTVKSSKYLVNPGEIIEVNIEMPEDDPGHLDPVNIPIEVLFEDENVIVINKQAGIVVHPGAGNKNNTLVHGLLYHFKELSSFNGDDRPGIVHRLDQDTSGVMIVAKNDSAHYTLSRQFEAKEVAKTYIGITWGTWDASEGTIEGYLNRRQKDPTAYELSDEGRFSHTDWKVLKEGRYLTAVEFFPKTGRTHQIRVHAASKNHPIFGDKKYGGGESRARGFLPEVAAELKKEIKKIGRHALHAHKLTLRLPGKSELSTFTAELPYDMSDLFSKIQIL